MFPVSSICICGGGSLAHVLAAVLGKQKQLHIRLLTRNPASWKKEIEINYRNTGILKGSIAVVSDNPAETVADAELVLITVPSFAYVELWNRIQPFVPENAIVGALAGHGGFEWIAHNHPGILFGMQRVPYVSRTEKYGELVFVTGVREKIFIGTRPAKAAPMVASILEPLFQLNVLPLPNYVNASLIPSNALFHSVRNYSLFQLSENTGQFNEPVLFYEAWDDLASTLYLECDKEIQKLCKQLPIDLSGIITVRQHYKAENATELSSVIRKIESLKGIETPMKRENDHWVTDYNHRFFTEDMLINLPYFLYFAELAGVQMPTIKKLFDWATEICNSKGVYSKYNVCAEASKAGVISLDAIKKFYA